MQTKKRNLLPCMLDVYDLYKKMESNKVLLSFKGAITSELLASILQIVEMRMIEFNDSSKERKKVFNVLVEILQNLYHHIDDFEVEGTPDEVNTIKSSIFMISRLPDCYHIISGNYLYTENVPKLKARIDHVNSLNKDELKRFYKETLDNGIISDKGGGGLGFIDIARKSGEKLDYKFIKIDEKYSFFTLIVKIPKVIKENK